MRKPPDNLERLSPVRYVFILVDNKTGWEVQLDGVKPGRRKKKREGRGKGGSKDTTSAKFILAKAWGKLEEYAVSNWKGFPSTRGRPC
jgi:hypothetical protein